MSIQREKKERWKWNLLFEDIFWFRLQGSFCLFILTRVLGVTRPAGGTYSAICKNIWMSIIAMIFLLPLEGHVLAVMHLGSWKVMLFQFEFVSLQSGKIKSRHILSAYIINGYYSVRWYSWFDHVRCIVGYINFRLDSVMFRGLCYIKVNHV